MCECAAHVMEGEEIDVGIATVGDTRIAPPAEAAKDRTDRDADFATEAEEDDAPHVMVMDGLDVARATERAS